MSNLDKEAIKAMLLANRPVRPLDGLAFLSRFSLDEYGTISKAAVTDPQLSLWMDMLRLKGAITVADGAAQDAKVYLVAKGLLTQERADGIFA